MRSASSLARLALPAALIGSSSGYAVTYLTIAEAQSALCPRAKLRPVDVTLSPDQRHAIEKTARVRVRPAALKAWRAADGRWFLVDQVIGKHEFITYAVVIGPDGAVGGLEILDYREIYGGEVRRRSWLAQFIGRTAAAPLQLDRDIKNISGATLSCRNLTDGVKRLLATHELVLRTLH